MLFSGVFRPHVVSGVTERSYQLIQGRRNTFPGIFSVSLSPAPLDRTIRGRPAASLGVLGGVDGGTLHLHEGSLQKRPSVNPDPDRLRRREHQSFMAPGHKERPHAFFIAAHPSFMVIT